MVEWRLASCRHYDPVSGRSAKYMIMLRISPFGNPCYFAHQESTHNKSSHQFPHRFKFLIDQIPWASTKVRHRRRFHIDAEVVIEGGPSCRTKAGVIQFLIRRPRTKSRSDKRNDEGRCSRLHEEGSSAGTGSGRVLHGSCSHLNCGIPGQLEWVKVRKIPSHRGSFYK
jgi:hypothetical protein